MTGIETNKNAAFLRYYEKALEKDMDKRFSLQKKLTSRLNALSIHEEKVKASTEQLKWHNMQIELTTGIERYKHIAKKADIELYLSKLAIAAKSLKPDEIEYLVKTLEVLDERIKYLHITYAQQNNKSL